MTTVIVTVAITILVLYSAIMTRAWFKEFIDHNPEGEELKGLIEEARKQKRDKKLWKAYRKHRRK